MCHLVALRRVRAVLATLGDLVEDVVIRVDDPINVASDTAAHIRRRRGGSAANVAATAARLGFPARFVGAVSIDVSSVALIEELGASETVAMLADLKPAVAFANSDEAESLGITGTVGEAITVIKNGGEPAVIYRDKNRHEIPANKIEVVEDTTEAGDTFAAAFLTANWRTDVVEVCRSAHRAAAGALASRTL